MLVAADGAADDSSLASRLKLEGFEVMTAIDGQEALQIAGSSWQPDVVLLDLTPPKVDVIQVCERLRVTNRSVVIFVFGGDSREGEIRRLDSCMRAGAHLAQSTLREDVHGSLTYSFPLFNTGGRRSV